MTTPALSAVPADAVVLLIVVASLVLASVVIYIWASVAMSAVFHKAGLPRWKAWVPVLNLWTLFELGRVPGAVSLLMFLPVLGTIPFLVFSVIAIHRVNRSFGLGAGMTVLGALLLPVWATVLGFGSARWLGEPDQPRALPLDGRAPRGYSGTLMDWAGGDGSAPALPVTGGSPALEQAVAVSEITAASPISRRHLRDKVPDGPPPSSNRRVNAPPPPGVAPVITPPSLQVAPATSSLTSVFTASVESSPTAEQAPAARPAAPPPAVPQRAVHPAALAPAAVPSPPPAPPQAAAPPAARIAPLSVPVTEVHIDASPRKRDLDEDNFEDADQNLQRYRDAVDSDFDDADSDDDDFDDFDDQGFDDDGPSDDDGPAGFESFDETTGASAPVSAADSEWARIPLGDDFAAAEVSAIAGAPVAGGPRAARTSIEARQYQEQESQRHHEPEDHPFEIPDETVIARRRRVRWSLTGPDGAPIELTEEQVLLGRRPVPEPEHWGAQLVCLDDLTVSKTHALLRLRDERWWITDLHSTNGILFATVMGTEVEAPPGVEVEAGEQFLLGDVRVRLTRSEG